MLIWPAWKNWATKIGEIMPTPQETNIFPMHFFE